MNLTYGINDKPKIGQLIVFALQQLLAIMAATIAVPAVVNSNVIQMGLPSPELSASAALFGAGIGTLVYLLFTRRKSPVFLGSSFAFLGSMTSAFAGAVSVSLGCLGIIMGAAIAGLVYVIIALVVKFVGTNWIDKVMPAVVIGPTVAIIGLSLAGNAVGDLKSCGWLGLICGLVTLFVTIICSVYGKGFIKMIPFIIGIGSGYVLATIFTLCKFGNPDIVIVDFSKFKNMEWIPNFTFIKIFDGDFFYGEIGNFGAYLATIFVAYAPVAFVVFAEHLADHKNLSSIVGTDLTKDPGLSNTLLGDGIGSFAGAIFGGACNTTYGESIATVAISKNASTITILVTALMAIVCSFIGPFATFLATIPSCVMGGVCFALYGFIAVSGLKMIKDVNLDDNKNLFVVSVILIAGIGGLTLGLGKNFNDAKVTLTAVASALILGIITNVVCNRKKDNKEVEAPAEETREESEN